MEKVCEPAREVPVVAEVDVCVVGGGPGGVPAAVAAARQGAKVLLIERHGFLGGMATAGLIGPILGHVASRSHVPVLGGIPRELCKRMAAIGQAMDWDEAVATCWGVPFDPEGFKIVADRLIREAGVRLMLHAFCVGSVVRDGRVTHVVVESKSGRQAVAAKIFVDATGDADVAFWAGAECTLGRPADGRPMAMGSMFRIGGVGGLDGGARDAALAAMRRAVQDGSANFYHITLGHLGSTVRADELTANITRRAGDGTRVEDLTDAELAIREQMWQALELWRSAPGAEGLYLIATPAHVGVRETRQVVGLARLTGQDVVDARKQPDGIARAGYWIDIHCPRGSVGQGTVHLCSRKCADRSCYMVREFADQLPDELYPPEGEWFDIPYRALVPVRVDGLLIAGRCISGDHQAMAAVRVMGTCMAIGEAAGTAAAMAADAGCQPRALDVPALRARLSAAGVLL